MMDNMRNDSTPAGSWRLHQLQELEFLASNDSFVMNALLKGGVDYPTIFSLLWGDSMADDAVFPAELRKLVTDIIQEIKKREESYDLVDKKLYNIIIDLLYVLYEKQVNDIVERAKEQIELYK